MADADELRPSPVDAERQSLALGTVEGPRQRKPRAVWVLGTALAAMTVVAGWALLRSSQLPVVRLAISLPEEQRVVYGGINLTPPRVALTPDGSNLIYTGGGREANLLPGLGGPATAVGQVALGVASQLWIRPLNQLEARPLSGTENGWAPAVSPDGEQSASMALARRMPSCVLAPNAKLRAAIVPRANSTSDHAAEHAPARMSWARLLERAFDIERCSKRGGSLKIIAAIEAQPVTASILTHLDLSAFPPPRGGRTTTCTLWTRRESASDVFQPVAGRSRR